MFVLSPRLRPLFAESTTWHIGEEDSEGEMKQVFATLQADRFPKKDDVWKNADEAQTTTFSCSLMTVDEYSKKVLFINDQGETSNQLAKFREEYALAHAEAFNRLYYLEGQTAGIQATTEELKTSMGDLQQKQLDLLRDQGAVNKSIEERLEKLEKQEERAMSEPPAKKQRFDRCPNRHHEQVKSHQWLKPGAVVLLKSHANQQFVVETWTGSHYILCGKISGKLVQSNTRNMFWCCGRCNVGTDVAA